MFQISETQELNREEFVSLFLSSVSFEDWTVDYRITQTPKWPLGSTQIQVALAKSLKTELKLKP